jgi:hypothetical protein
VRPVPPLFICSGLSLFQLHWHPQPKNKLILISVWLSVLTEAAAAEQSCLPTYILLVLLLLCLTQSIGAVRRYCMIISFLRVLFSERAIAI